MMAPPEPEAEVPLDWRLEVAQKVRHAPAAPAA
jgi:hypothetical protein